MTENKRFIPIFDGIDKRVVGAKDNGEIISFMDMFDLLNEQSDKITEQSIQIDFLKDENKHMKQVLEENRQLKKEIKNGDVE